MHVRDLQARPTVNQKVKPGLLEVDIFCEIGHASDMQVGMNCVLPCN